MFVCKICLSVSLLVTAKVITTSLKKSESESYSVIDLIKSKDIKMKIKEVQVKLYI